MNTPESKDAIDLSIVIPVYNSASIFPELYRRLNAVLDRIGASAEILAVLDGCTDNSYEVISGLRRRDERVKLLEFSRNFGHQAAISAGLHFASGRMVVIMDDDLEDPPEILPKLVSRLIEGFDVVYGIRKNRKRSLFYRMAYFLFYRVQDKFIDTEIPYDTGDFCVMKKEVVDVLNNMPERKRFLRGLRSWAGFRQTGVEYDRGKRFCGTSGYSLKKYFGLALNGIFSFSHKPLTCISLFGSILTFLGFLSGFGLALSELMVKTLHIPGWIILFLVILFLSGVQLLSVGLIGEYIARIHDEVRHRPEYVISRLSGLETQDNKRQA